MKFLKYVCAVLGILIPLQASAILKTQSWPITLTTAGTAQNIYNSSFPNLRYVPSFRVFNNNSSATTDKIYVGGSDISASNGEPIFPQFGASFTNEETTGQTEKLFDLQGVWFDADVDATEVIITVIYDDDL